VVSAHVQRLQNDAIYSREDVQRMITDTAFDVVERSPSFMDPGFAMLAGALVLAFSRKGATSSLNVA
jgi:hypothetical protein